MSFNIYRELKKYKLLCLRVQEQRQHLLDAGDESEGHGISWEREAESALLGAMEAVERRQYGFICNSVDDMEAITTSHQNEEGEDVKADSCIMRKTFNAFATCFDFNEGTPSGPFALFSIDSYTMRIPVYMTAEELRNVMSNRECRITITIDPPSPSTEPQDEEGKT